MKPQFGLRSLLAAHPATARRRWITTTLVLAALVVGIGLFSVQARQQVQAEPAAAPEQAPWREERERLLRENAELGARLREFEAQEALAGKLDAQAARLARLAERLEARLDQADADALMAPGGAPNADRTDPPPPLAAARSRIEELEATVAQLEARLKQQQLSVEEAALRADKAEKLHAALEESHARVLTENERMSLELANAKERQAQAMQRVVELDSQLEVTAARAGVAIPTTDAPPPARGSDAAAEPSPAPPGSATVVYEVREEDTLSRIAEKVYGDSSAWRRIFDANRDVLNGPDDLALGMRLIIP